MRAPDAHRGCCWVGPPQPRCRRRLAQPSHASLHLPALLNVDTPAQEFIAMTIMATRALLLFEQGRFLPPGVAPLWPPLAGMLVGGWVGGWMGG